MLPCRRHSPSRLLDHRNHELGWDGLVRLRKLPPEAKTSHWCDRILLTMEARDLDSAIDAVLLPYLPRERIKLCYAHSPGNELRAKFFSPQSSAALVANAFGLFLENPAQLEGLPGGPIQTVDLEKSLRFPWSGGRHPYLDVVITGSETLVGIESKRYEPFRGHTVAEISAAYRRPVWGAEMS